mmetsp:Transcript_33782/g.61258  ORF Transcript_33782/g.61258 Transcript_33782/m.61258 type:complete len:438 (+) Transcript_33782:88-1401(+)
MSPDSDQTEEKANEPSDGKEAAKNHELQEAYFSDVKSEVKEANENGEQKAYPEVKSEAKEAQAGSERGQVPSSLPPIAAASDAPYSEESKQDAPSSSLDVTARLPEIGEEQRSESLVAQQRGHIHAQLGHHKKEEPAAREEPESEPEKLQAGARKAARSRIKARQELEATIAQEAEARQKAREQARALSSEKAEEARRKARQRIAAKRKNGKPSLEMPSVTRLEGPSESDTDGKSPRSYAAEARARSRVKKNIERKRTEEATIRYKQDQEKVMQEIRREDEKEKVKEHRAQLAREAYAKLREEKRRKAEGIRRKEFEEQEARQKLQWYKSPAKIAERKLKSAAEAAAQPSMVEERREKKLQDELWMDQERARARHHLDHPNEPYEVRAPEGKPRQPQKERPVPRKRPSSPPDDDDGRFARTVVPLTDEDWTLDIRIF